MLSRWKSKLSPSSSEPALNSVLEGLTDVQKQVLAKIWADRNIVSALLSLEVFADVKQVGTSQVFIRDLVSLGYNHGLYNNNGL